MPAAVAAGVLIDSDHVLDYYRWYVNTDRRQVFVLFHGWEYAIAGAALGLTLAYHPLLLAALLGYVGHLVGDQLANKPIHPLAYSIGYRAYRGFNRSKLFRDSSATFSEAMNESIPLWGLIEPRLLSMADMVRRRAK